MKHLSILIAIVITIFFCSWPGFSAEALFHLKYRVWIDVAFHGSYFFVLSVLLVRKFPNGKHFLLIMLATAACLEFVQLLVPGRTFTLVDLTSNVSGVVLGWVTGKIANTGNPRPLWNVGRNA